MNSEADSHDDGGAVSTPATPALPCKDAATSEADRVTNVLFFDGVCGLCNRSVDFVLSRDRRHTIRFAPLQGETAKRLQNSEPRSRTTDLALAANTLNTVVWLDSVSHSFVRSAAVVRVLWQIGGPWWLIGWGLWLIPRPLRDMGYRLVATNRYRWFGHTASCRLPTAAERSRFLP